MFIWNVSLGPLSENLLSNNDEEYALHHHMKEGRSVGFFPSKQPIRKSTSCWAWLWTWEGLLFLTNGSTRTASSVPRSHERERGRKCQWDNIHNYVSRGPRPLEGSDLPVSSDDTTRAFTNWVMGLKGWTLVGWGLLASATQFTLMFNSKSVKPSFMVEERTARRMKWGWRY